VRQDIIKTILGYLPITALKTLKEWKITPLEIKINEHKEQLKAVVTDLNGTDIFLGHNWLVKHNTEVNWKNRTIKFTRCLRTYTCQDCKK